MKEVYAAQNRNLDQAMARWKKAANEAGLPFGERKNTYNSRRAHELGKWAETKDKGDEFQNAVFRAYFVDGINIAKTDELMRLVKLAGLPGNEAREILQMGVFRQAVDSDWALSDKMEIELIPTFVLDQERLVGPQSYEVLEQFLLDNGVKRR
jgi:predicted DsbA family dithiol-disulfide isomerase